MSIFFSSNSQNMASIFGLIPESKSIDKLSVKQVVETQDVPVIVDLPHTGDVDTHIPAKIGGKHLRFSAKKESAASAEVSKYILPKAVPGVKATVFITTGTGPESDDDNVKDGTTFELKCSGGDKLYGIQFKHDSQTGKEGVFFVEGMDKLSLVTASGASADIKSMKATHAFIECMAPGIWTVKSVGLFEAKPFSP